MVPFYDAKDEADLARVEQLLSAAGIEYFVMKEPSGGICSLEIEVAEEDVPQAEEILLGAGRR